MSAHFGLEDLRLMVRVVEEISRTKGVESSLISLPASGPCHFIQR